MQGWYRVGVVGMLAVAALSGCAHGSRCVARHGSHGTATLEAMLPPVQPGAIEIDVTQVGTLAEVNSVLGLPGDPDRYYALTAEQCQCMAAAASSQGDTLASERRAIEATAPRRGLSEENQVRVRVLRASEEEARNTTASAALQVFYRLAEAEANRGLAELSLAEIDDALEKIDQLRRQMIPVPLDASEVERQRLDLLDKQVQLEWTVGQLNFELIQLLGLWTDDLKARVWPVVDWKVPVAAIDVDVAVAVGLDTRPEIRLLSSMSGWLETSTLGVTRQVLGGTSGLLGMQSKFTTLIPLLGIRDLFGQRRANVRELPGRRRQLEEHTQQRRREITTEIRQAVQTVEARLRQIALAKEQSLSWQRRIEQLQEMQAAGRATFMEVTTAELSALQAQSDEVGSVVAWKIALVELAEAQGLLIDECKQLWCGPVEPQRVVEQPAD